MDTDVAVIGAGPYGLAISAHLSGEGVSHEIFGEPMDTWRSHMPVGMLLKSEGFASNISDPHGEHTLERYCAERDIEYGALAAPIKLDTFAGYGLAFQERAVPGLRRVRVDSLQQAGRGRTETGQAGAGQAGSGQAGAGQTGSGQVGSGQAGKGFQLGLDSGETVHARRVVVATGVQGLAYLPPELSGLPSDAAVHCYDFQDPSSTRGKQVAVIGAGQSALEAAALIHEQGGTPIVVLREQQVAWNSKPGGSSRPLRERWRYPASGLGEGREQWFCANLPLAYHAAPRRRRVSSAYAILGPAGAWWLRPRIEGHLSVRTGISVAQAQVENGAVSLRLQGSAGSEELKVDKVVAGTGYRAGLDRMPFIDPQLRGGIATPDVPGIPALDRHFQSSVPGLYFVGYTAAISFGPLMRFVFGTDFTARRLTRQLRKAFST